MSNFSSIAASYLANSVWEIALVTALGYLMSRLVKRLGVQFEHAVWVATLMIAVVTPALPFLRGLTASLIAVPSPGQRASIVLIASQNGLPGSRPAFVLPQAVLWLLLALYVAAVLYFAGRLVISLVGASALLRKAGPAFAHSGAR